MISIFKFFALAIGLVSINSCSKDNSNANNNQDADIPNAIIGKIINTSAISAWNNLSQAEKNKVDSWNTLFLHQSVGGDLEDGSNTNGFSFEYYAYGSTITNQGLCGGLFQASNGNPLDKISQFKTQAILNKNSLRVAVFKFGYDDVIQSLLPQIKTAYKSMVDDLKQNGIRVLHISPPLVFDAAYNQPKMDLRVWMIDTFKSDVIFDLADIESTDLSNNKVQNNGVWHLYSGYRSIPGCESYNQGTDQPSQGHLCNTAANRISKAFLYAIYVAGK